MERIIRDITRESLRTSYGMVLQDTWLRSGTIRDNITMGREGFTDEQIITAAKEAHSYSFIKKDAKGVLIVYYGRWSRNESGTKTASLYYKSHA